MEKVFILLDATRVELARYDDRAAAIAAADRDERVRFIIDEDHSGRQTEVAEYVP